MASSFSLGGALVAECFTINKETKMMSLFHPEKFEKTCGNLIPGEQA